MKKNVLVFLLSGIICCSVAHAQKDTGFSHNSFIERFNVEFDFTGSTSCKNTRLMNVGAKLGFDITSKLYVFASYENMNALNNADGVNSYMHGGNFGGGLGLRLLNVKLSNSKLSYDGNINVYGMMAFGVGNTDWKQAVYEGGLKWKLRKGLSPTVGLGFRHTNSRTTGMPNHNAMVGSVGFSF